MAATPPVCGGSAVSDNHFRRLSRFQFAIGGLLCKLKIAMQSLESKPLLLCVNAAEGPLIWPVNKARSIAIASTL